VAALGCQKVIFAGALCGAAADPEPGVPRRSGGDVVGLVRSVSSQAGSAAPVVVSTYNQRWEHEPANDQLKTHLRGPGKVLRLRLPDLVHQKIWA
jgi:hypothetical protein